MKLPANNSGNSYLLLTVFFSGMTVLATELSASRLLDPFFGNSLIIWANLIGLVLVYLSIGYWLGGKWADKSPHPKTYFQIIAWGAFLVGIIPALSHPILQWSLDGFATFDAGILIGSLLGVLLLFSLPMILLAMSSPFAIRLAVQKVSDAGAVAGKIYALSTLGSILGTFLPVLVFIPNIGTRRTFLLFSMILFFVALGGLFQISRKLGLAYLSLLILLVIISIVTATSTIKSSEYAIFETESQYNYIQVEKINGDILLRLNEGEGIHSVYNPDFVMAGGIWDYFLIAPFFNAAPYAEKDVGSLLMIGSAAGTIPKEYTAVFGDIPIDGVELDPAISQAGRDFFAMNETNLNTVNQDGRYFLNTTDETYDVIAVDAYRPPYIPFQLTTQEFFAEIYNHLNDDGVMAINAGRAENDYSLVVALGSTMKSVFPNVYVIDAPSGDLSLGNSLVIATKSPTQFSDFLENLPLLQNELLRQMAQRTLNTRVWEINCQNEEPFAADVNHLPAALPDQCSAPFTDDKAPVEQVLHQLILRYLLGG